MNQRTAVLLIMSVFFLFTAPLYGGQFINLDIEDKYSDQFEFRMEPSWFRWLDIFSGFWANTQSGMGWYNQFNSRFLRIQTSKDLVVRAGFHFGEEGAQGHSDEFRWYVHSLEGGISLSVQGNSWQANLNLSYKALYQDGRSRVSSYKLDWQVNDLFKLEGTFEYYLKRDSFNLFQLMWRVEADLGGDKKSFWEGVRLSKKDDPLASQSVYGGGVTIHIYNKRQNQSPFVPMGIFEVFHYEWNGHTDIMVGGGARIYEVAYLNIRGVFPLGGKMEMDNALVIGLGFDLGMIMEKAMGMGGHKKIRFIQATEVF